MHLNFILEYFFIYFSLRFTDKYRKELGYYGHLRNLIADYETDYPGLATSFMSSEQACKSGEYS